MELITLLLLVGFRHRIEEPDSDSGLLRVAAIAGLDIDTNAFHAAIAGALADGLIRDPVQLRPGALQCRWHLELTPRGAGQVQKLLRENGKTSDDLIVGARMAGSARA